ncbi:MAG: response regulator [Nanoarchaeota archaeon]
MEKIKKFIKNKMTEKILIADDDESVLTSMEWIFPKENTEFYRDGNSLDKRLEQGPEGISLVITDNNMQGPNGSMLIKKYAKQENFRNIPFILHYGGDESIGEKAVEDGAFRYFIKGNYNIKDLRDLVNLLTKKIG